MWKEIGFKILEMLASTGIEWAKNKLLKKELDEFQADDNYIKHNIKDL